MAKTAILVDGGFYRKRAAHLWGKKTAEERAKELNAYCMAHLHDKDGNEEVTFKPYRYMFRPQAIKAWYDLEALQREQQ